jgi:hypothetical protein
VVLDLLFRKEEILAREYPFDSLTVVTNNKTDVGLVRKASHACIVAKHKDVPFWRRGLDNIEIVEVVDD